MPTSFYESQRADEEYPPSYNPSELTDGGHKPAFLYVEKGPGSGQLVPVRQGPLVIGRASISDLRLQHASISRRHAQLTRVEDRFYLKDLGSQNGTFVNRQRIATEIEIFPGDQLTLGNATLKLRGPLGRPQTPGILRADLRRTSDSGAVSARMTDSKPVSNVVRVALFAAAIGFGLAGVLMFAFFKLPRTPTYQNLVPAAPVAAPQVATAEVAGASPVQIEIEPSVVTREPAALAEAPAPEAPEAEAKPEAAPPAPPSPAPKEETARAGRPESAKEEPTKPLSAKGSARHHEILARYEEGKLSAAMALARQAKNEVMLEKLTEFQKAYRAARKAMAAKDGTSAIRNYEAALRVDSELSAKDWSSYGRVIRKQLGFLWTLVGLHHLSSGSKADARKAFEVALKHDPSNAKAQGELRKLSGKRASSRAATRARRSRAVKADAIDAAFED